MPQFVLLMREDDDAWSRIGAAERDRLMGLYGAWIGELRAKGAFVGGAPIGGGGRVLRHHEGEFREATYAESKQVDTGYFVIEAPTLDAATHLARGCPALLHGETVIVRPLGHD